MDHTFRIYQGTPPGNGVYINLLRKISRIMLPEQSFCVDLYRLYKCVRTSIPLYSPQTYLPRIVHRRDSPMLFVEFNSHQL